MLKEVSGSILARSKVSFCVLSGASWDRFGASWGSPERLLEPKWPQKTVISYGFFGPAGKSTQFLKLEYISTFFHHFDSPKGRRLGFFSEALFLKCFLHV